MLAACTSDAIVVEVDGDLPVGAAVDAICLAVADTDPAGGHFGQVYPLAYLPQTLRVEPGEASGARAWVIGYRAGVPVAHDAASIDFGDDVTLRLDRCGDNPGDAPQMRGGAVGPASAVIAPIVGRGGTKVIAMAGGEAVLIDASGGGLVDAPAFAAPPGNALAVIAFDADGDCDDDVIAVGDGGAPELWRVEGDTFTADGRFGTTAVRAAAAADIDRDGDVDVLTAIGSTLAMYKNDGSGRFTAAPAAITGVGFVGSATSLAFGDLDGDHSVDLVVGQAAAPLRAFAGAPGGVGAFTGAPGALPDVAVDARSIRLADADGDGLPDLWVAVSGGPARLYMDRAGTLENQSYNRLPQPTPEVNGFAVAGWDADCAIDAVAAALGGAQLWRGDGNGNLTDDGDGPPSSAAELVDLDDDGDLDLVTATPQGVIWLAR